MLVGKLMALRYIASKVFLVDTILVVNQAEKTNNLGSYEVLTKPGPVPFMIFKV